MLFHPDCNLGTQ